MKTFAFTQTASAQYEYWKENDQRIRDKIKDLLKAILDDPYKGIGKPEPLKHQLKGCWSRRINKEHRLVYQVKKNDIIIISCKYHY